MALCKTFIYDSPIVHRIVYCYATNNVRVYGPCEDILLENVPEDLIVDDKFVVMHNLLEWSKAISDMLL